VCTCIKLWILHILLMNAEGGHMTISYVNKWKRDFWSCPHPPTVASLRMSQLNNYTFYCCTVQHMKYLIYFKLNLIHHALWEVINKYNDKWKPVPELIFYVTDIHMYIYTYCSQNKTYSFPSLLLQDCGRTNMKNTWEKMLKTIH
jgi:hypothetical protein